MTVHESTQLLSKEASVELLSDMLAQTENEKRELLDEIEILRSIVFDELGQWEVFDEFVHRIGVEDEWEHPDGIGRPVYRVLVAAGLLAHRPNYPVEMYGLTDAGRREVCQRDGQHDYDKNRPASDGCQTCDASLCPSCSGYGSLSDPAESRPDVRCDDCDATGLANS